MDGEPFAPVRARRTFEAVVEQIADAVRTGELRRGDRLPSERALANRMEVSRPTLREAIQVLADSGVVEVRPGARGGTFVISDSVPPALLERMQSRVSEVPAALEARRAVEPEVVKLAARNATDEELDRLAEIVALQREVLDDWPRITQLDNQFHSEIAHATRNPVLVSVMAMLSRELEIARATRMDESIAPAEAVAVNEETVEAMRSRDDARIDEVMDRHLRLLEQAWAGGAPG